MTLWDGHMQIPQKDSVAPECFTTWGNLVTITEKHPDIEDMGDNIFEVQACVINDNQNCIRNTYVLMRKCNGSLLYSFPWYNVTNTDTWNRYICFDRIYTKLTCKEALSIQTIEKENDNILQVSLADKHGWIETFIDRKQYILPYLNDTDIIFGICSLTEFDHWDYMYFLQEPLPDEIGEDPVRINVCYGYKYDDGSVHIYFYDNGNCDNFVYVRSCGGKLQFDLSLAYHTQMKICLIHYNTVKVLPEISHEETTIIEDGQEVIMYTSSLQYRCSFDAISNTQYLTNWYINGTFQVQVGPSSSIDDLIFKGKYITGLKHGYEVRCGVFSSAENESMELLSDAYHAGWKISKKDITLSKTGVVTVTIEQTSPIGCSYTANNISNCFETLSFDDHTYMADDCSGRIEVKTSGKSVVEIKSLCKGEVWTNKKYNILLSTIDNDYDDETKFDLSLLLSDNIGETSTPEVVGTIHVDITDTNRHWNKRCYSHVDPHMKTVDGLHYEAQREGDYTLYLNKKFQTEIQTSARYCWPGNTRGPVCACGIAIAVGADVFLINRCLDKPFKFDLTCGDGGLIDIEHIHDYRYRVRTPIGTNIEIFLWGDVMNIDVYMSAKDFGNVAGLCGNFDGHRSNDLQHRDGTISYDNNKSYKFADSWRLTDEENLFKNTNRILERWNERNAGKTCTKPNSITRNKCKIRKRNKRSSYERSEMRSNQYHHHLSRKKRSSSSFTEDEAFQLCNHSIYTTPAVQQFPDHLAEEDPDSVVEQCVYDLTQGNDTVWIDAHVSVLNNAADTILSMNPVYVANNTEKVNLFRSETCLNNCSGNGICTNTGLCECSGTFKGPDCSIDIRIPPIIHEIEGGGICSLKVDDDCTCFQIRTDNIFDGFMCEITEFKVNYNGSRLERSTSVDPGFYEDIFTGECCVPFTIQNNSFVLEDVNDGITVLMYEFSISNDGVNYGDVTPVYIYDTTCIEQIDIDGNVTFRLKDKFCFIDATCTQQNFKLVENETCFVCDPGSDPFSWTMDDCEDSSASLGTAGIVGIVIGTILFVMVTVVGVYILKKKHSSAIGVHPKDLVPENAFRIKTAKEKDCLRNYQSPAKPRFEQNLMLGTACKIFEISGELTVSSREDTSVFKADTNASINEEIAHYHTTQNKEESKRDISFIDLELN